MSDLLGTDWGPNTPLNGVSLPRFVTMVRFYMRDFGELNRLIKGEEHSDRMIAWAVMDTIADFNGTPPITRYSLANFPAEATHLLRKGTVATLLESVGLLQTRNHLSFSDGGIQSAFADKTPLIQSWIQLLKNDYESKKQSLKIAMNIENAWGDGVWSEYAWTNGFYGGW